MIRADPVLELADALPSFEASTLPNVPLDLALQPGECALIETHDPERATAFADLCSGMIVLRRGAVHCMGFDWTALAPDQAAALRGRIGRIYQKSAWTGMLRTHLNIMLPQLHHTRTPETRIAQSAIKLAQALGLPGLPLVRPERLSQGDLIRAACVRAFLGEPRLLLLETSIDSGHAEITTPFLELLSQALSRGASAVCFTREAAIWREAGFPLNRRLTLLETGLVPMRGG